MNEGEERGEMKEEYIRILSEIADGNVDDLENKLNKAKWICNYWISDDPCEEILIKAYQTIFKNAELVPRALESITSFIYMYFNRFVERSEEIASLLDLADNYLKEHLASKYETPIIGAYKSESIRLRAVIAERRRTKNPYGLEFVLNDDESIDRILSMFREVYDTPEDFISEVVEGLNFSYGVKDKSCKVFLTGLTYGANSIEHYNSFDLIRFAIIMGEERNVLMLDCRRDTSDGSIRIHRPYETTMAIPANFDEYREILTQMIAFYRSKPERDNFGKMVKALLIVDELMPPIRDETTVCQRKCRW
ncbi:hypothetical protein [Desulfosporosinus hippei]|nr:hypothetical protein [Desulfosporosinus hippei]